MRLKSKTLRILIVFALLILSAAVIEKTSVRLGFDPDLWLMRQFYEIRGQRAVPEDVVIVSIDDESFQKLGLSTKRPVPAKLIAEALERIAIASPKILILDSAVLSSKGSNEDQKRISTALKSGTTVAYNETIVRRDSVNISGQSIPNPLREVEPLLIAGVEGPLIESQGVIATYPSKLPSHVYRLLSESDRQIEKAKYINFYGPQWTLRRLAFSQLMEKGGAELKDKVVFVGLESVNDRRGQIDSNQFETPIGEKRMFGAEIQATAVANLRDQSFLRETGRPLTRLLLAGSAILCGIAVVMLSFKSAAISLLVCSALLLALSYFSFSVFYFWIARVLVVISLSVIAIAAKGILIIPGVSRRVTELRETFRLG